MTQWWKDTTLYRIKSRKKLLCLTAGQVIRCSGQLSASVLIRSLRHYILYVSDVFANKVARCALNEDGTIGDITKYAPLGSAEYIESSDDVILSCRSTKCYNWS